MSELKSDKDLMLFVLEQVEELEQYLNGIEEYYFYNNNMLKDACFTKLLVIGEYSKRISNLVKEKHREIKWERIAKARNFYAHGYGMADWTQIWETLKNEIPHLKQGFENILTGL